MPTIRELATLLADRYGDTLAQAIQYVTTAAHTEGVRAEGVAAGGSAPDVDLAHDVAGRISDLYHEAWQAAREIQVREAAARTRNDVDLAGDGWLGGVATGAAEGESPCNCSNPYCQV